MPNKGSYLFKKEKLCKQRNGSDTNAKKGISSKKPDEIYTALKETFPYGHLARLLDSRTKRCAKELNLNMGKKNTRMNT